MAPSTIFFATLTGPIVDVSERYYATYRQALTQVGAAATNPGTDLRWLSNLSSGRLSKTAFQTAQIAPLVRARGRSH